MTINTYYIYTQKFTCRFFTADGVVLRYEDRDTLDNIHDQMCKILVHHNFTEADVCSETGEVIMVIKQS